MGIVAGKVVINNNIADKKTLMDTRNISLAKQYPRDETAPIPTTRRQVTVTENGVTKEVFKTSKYLDDLTK